MHSLFAKHSVQKATKTYLKKIKLKGVAGVLPKIKNKTKTTKARTYSHKKKRKLMI